MFDLEKIYKPETIGKAVDVLKVHPDAVVIAGGTDVLVKMRAGKLGKTELVYIREIKSLRGVSVNREGTIKIGAATCFDDIYRNEICRKYIPILSDACNTVGSPQIRNIATIGGNICNGAVSADSVPALYVLDAELEFAGAYGRRTMPITEFHTGPGKTAIKAGELLVSIRIKKENYKNFCGNYIKFGQRNSMEISTLGCAALVKLDAGGKKVECLKLAYGVAAPVPVRCRKLEKAVKGMTVGDGFYDYVSANAISELQPRDSWRASLELREQLIKTLGRRAVQKSVELCGGQK